MMHVRFSLIIADPPVLAGCVGASCPGGSSGR